MGKRHPAVDRTCERCGAAFRVQPNVVAKGKGRYCSKACATVAQVKPAQLGTCGWCGRELRAAAGRRLPLYCGREHAGLARRRRLTATCQQCEKAFEIHAGRRDSARFCSRACSGVANRSEVPIACGRCGRLFDVDRGRAGRRRFCSRACYRGGATVRVACENCGAERPLYQSQRRHTGAGRYCSVPCRDEARRRGGRVSCPICTREFHLPPSLRAQGRRYCSMACYGISQRRRASVRCLQCSKSIEVRAGDAGRRKYCSRRCVRLARAPTKYRCGACREDFKAPAWRRPQFCSLSCANTGRHRERQPTIVERDGRILELDGAGLKSAAIVVQLRKERPADPRWDVSAAGVRTVLMRTRRGEGAPHERNATGRQGGPPRPQRALVQA